MGWMMDAGRHPKVVGRKLLGWTIACRGTAAVITETEAYHQDEPAAHSYGGRPTDRTRALFGPPGTAYVYLSYGMHRCANLVTGADGSGEAVLLRSAMPVAGERLVRERRVQARSTSPDALRDRELLTGPGRLAQGLDIRIDDSGRAMLRTDLETLDAALDASVDGPVVCRLVDTAAEVGITLPIDAGDVLVGPRIGISKAIELPWRFGVLETAVSRPFPRART